jgi:hypothetical protein
MGLMICRWANSEDDGIYWTYDDAPPKQGETLFALMERYLTTGETTEILKYVPDTGEGFISKAELIPLLTREREAHAP